MKELNQNKYLHVTTQSITDYENYTGKNLFNYK